MQNVENQQLGSELRAHLLTLKQVGLEYALITGSSSDL